MKKNKQNIWPEILLFFIMTGQTMAADVLDVMPVTNTILCLHIVDGHVDYGTYGSQATSAKAYKSPLKISQVSTLTNYGISSANDPNYSSLAHPIYAGRKSRGRDYVSMYSSAKYILEHYVYLELPAALQNEKTYTLSITNLNVDNGETFQFVFNDKTKRSPTVHVNQVGYSPASPKHAYLSQWMGDFTTATHADGSLNLNSFTGAQFHVVRVADTAVVYSGSIQKRLAKNIAETQSAEFPIKNFSNADVWECDFSSFSTPGIYVIAVDGIGCSFPFEIDSDVYRDAYYYVSKAIFTQRQGINKELEGGEIYPRDYHPADRNVFYEGTTTKVNLWGWYHDAGDWDGYERHVRVPIDLMLLYDMNPENFRDGDVSNRYKLSDAEPWIDEGANGLPDILDEAKWLLSFYRRGKEALVAIGKGDGGVPSGQIGPDAGCENRASWTDERTVYVGAQDVNMTYNYAAVASFYSLCLQKFYGTSNAETLEWLDEATAAWDWATAHGSSNHDEKMLAAVLLYRAIGETKYQTIFKNLYSASMNGDYWLRPDLPQYAIILYSLLPSSTPGLDVSFHTNVKNKVIQSADANYLNPATQRGFRLPFSLYRAAFNGVFSTPRVLFLAAAYELTKEEKYLDYIYHVANYTLGGNQNNMVYVSQLGWNPDNNTFHPDSWRLIDYNHKVYTNPSLPGYVNYWGHADGDWFDGTSFQFDGDEDWSRSTAYPAITKWPAGEWRMNNRLSIPGSEFTMEECLSQALFAYGYLCDHSLEYTPQARPTVVLHLSGNNPHFSPLDTLTLSVDASENTYKVEYYYEWHLLGNSLEKANKFIYNWVPDLPDGEYLITAKAYTIKGLPTLPTPAGEQIITIVNNSAVEKIAGTIPSFDLAQNYPNPFNPTTTIEFQIPAAVSVSLTVYDISGREVKSLFDQTCQPGFYTVQWNGTDSTDAAVESGLYFYQIRAGDFVQVKKSVLIR